jgi:hypothetical protein
MDRHNQSVSQLSELIEGCLEDGDGYILIYSTNVKPDEVPEGMDPDDISKFMGVASNLTIPEIGVHMVSASKEIFSPEREED